MLQRRTQDDDFDFKPFFDLIVGMLFILLIMISAQLFFAQWNKAIPELEQQKLTELREAEITALLDRLAGRLTGQGLKATINRSAQSVTVELPLPAGANANLPKVEAGIARTLASTLESVTGCATEKHSGVAGCPRYDHVRMRELQLTASAPQGGSSAAAVLLAAQILEATPALGALQSPGGKPVLDPRIITAGPDSAATSSVDLTALIRFAAR